MADDIVRVADQDGPEEPAGPAPPAASAALAAAVTPVPGPERREGVFTRGSILRHVLVMTLTSAVGIMALFVVDLLSLLYVARLGQTEATAAVGYATQVLFYAASVNIGLTIGVSALVSRALGAGDRERARRICASGLVFTLVIGAGVAGAMMVDLPGLLSLLGAEGEIKRIATRFLWITLPANVPFALGMVLSGALRAVGDARRAMYVTLIGAILTGAIDPVLIFGLHFGVYGAAMSTVVARFVFLLVGGWGVVRVHNLLGRPSRQGLATDLRPLLGIALPAIATNLATPVGNSYVLYVFSRYGSQAIAATTVTDRLVPVAFGVLFALTGAVGPILGQNLGARRYDRMRRTLTVSFVLVGSYVLVTWGLLWLAAPTILKLFAATGDAARYILFFCHAGVAAWMFLGFLFVANAAFNNLGFPWLSLLFNWGRATLGTIPFVTLGAASGGVIGGQLGIVAGAAIFGTAALATAYLVAGRLAKGVAVPYGPSRAIAPEPAVPSRRSVG